MPDRLNTKDSDKTYYSLRSLIIKTPAKSGSALVQVLSEQKILTNIQLNGYFGLWREILKGFKEEVDEARISKLLDELDFLVFESEFSVSIRLEVAGLRARFSSGERDSYVIKILKTGTTDEKLEAIQLILTNPISRPDDLYQILNMDPTLKGFIPLLERM